MIAPSPDWFSGFYDFDPRDPSSNTWYGEFIIETHPWDAGTEIGASYSTSNDPEPTNVPILRLDEDCLAENTRISEPRWDNGTAGGKVAMHTTDRS